MPVYNPTPGLSLKDGDFRGLPDRELPGHDHRNINFYLEIDQKVGKFAANCCTADFPLCSGGDLNPHALRHTPLKRTCLPFHHPSSGGTQLVSRTMLLASVSSISGEARSSGVQELPARDNGFSVCGGCDSSVSRRKISIRLRRRGDNRDLDPFSRPGVFQNFPPIL